MFDFDLEDIPEERTQQLPLGELLPRVQRTRHCPGWTCTPEGTKKREEFCANDKRREPRLYVFIFPGCSDTVQNGWVDFESSMPDYLEAVTYEWPGHYERTSEPLASSLWDLANDAMDTLRKPMSTGRFIVVGHSVGASIMTCVCQLAQKELGVGPLLAISLDRGAPHIPVYSDYGLELLEDDPEEWCRNYSPGVMQLKDQPGSIFYETHIHDQKLANDIRPAGWYKFPCPVLVFAAAWQGDRPLPGTQDEQDRLEAYEAILRPGVGVQAFTPEEFELWDKWTPSCKVYHCSCGHGELRLSMEWIQVLMDKVRGILEAATIPCNHLFKDK